MFFFAAPKNVQIKISKEIRNWKMIHIVHLQKSTKMNFLVQICLTWDRFQFYSWSPQIYIIHLINQNLQKWQELAVWNILKFRPILMKRT